MLTPTLNPNLKTPIFAPPATLNPTRFSQFPRRHLRPPNSQPAPDPPGPSEPDPVIIIPKKPRRGRRSEAAAVEDFIRDSLRTTFDTIKKQSSGQDSGQFEEVMDSVIKEKTGDGSGPDNDEKSDGNKKGMVVEEECDEWPLDAEVGWGIRASDYFEKHAITNVVGEDGVEINWEGEIDYGLVKEINCLEWESFAFRPSPLVVLVFERYNRATDNWNALMELEKAAVVFWKAKDRLPPRTVKIDINIEKDLAYALQIKECPQILFLRGNRILYREPELRTSDELVQMIAHFYYNARRPPWMKRGKSK